MKLSAIEGLGLTKKISLYSEFPRELEAGYCALIPLEWIRACEWLGGDEREWKHCVSHFPPTASYVICTGKWPALKKIVSQFQLYFYLIFICFDYIRNPFIVSLPVIRFMMSIKNSNRCDEILIWDWQRKGVEITDGTGKWMGIKPGWTGPGMEWEWTIGNEKEWD